MSMIEKISIQKQRKKVLQVKTTAKNVSNLNALDCLFRNNFSV